MQIIYQKKINIDIVNITTTVKYYPSSRINNVHILTAIRVKYILYIYDIPIYKIILKRSVAQVNINATWKYLFILIVQQMLIWYCLRIIAVYYRKIITFTYGVLKIAPIIPNIIHLNLCLNSNQISM